MRPPDSRAPRYSEELATFGERLAWLRTQRGWSQQRLMRQLALVAATTGQHLPASVELRKLLNRWEHDHRLPDLNHQRLLATALGVEHAAFAKCADTERDEPVRNDARRSFQHLYPQSRQ